MSQILPLFQSVVLTLFPELFPGPLGASILGEALRKGIWTLDLVPIREFALDKHQSVDDTPFGGGPGMVMRADVLDRAVQAALDRLPAKACPRMLCLSPRGKPLIQKCVTNWVQSGNPMVLLCGRYEGIDQRLLDAWDFEDVALGDFVLAGGELPAMALLEACVRLLPGVLGKPDSLEEESFSKGLLEYPHYTRPRVWKEKGVPEVLLSGHHGHIHAWRLEQSKALTKARRPDLWEQYERQHVDEKGKD